MKFKILISAIFLVGLFCHSCLAQQWRKDRYDTRWLPITDTEIERQVQANSQDAVALYRLFDQARYQHKQQPYFAALQALKKKQPKNGVVLATHCAVLMDSNALYGFGQFKFQVDPKEGNAQTIERNIEVAKVLAPKLWLTFLVEADIAFFTNGDRLEGTKQAVKLCRQAVELEPDLTYTNEKLGYYLSNLAREQKTSYEEATRFYKKAQQTAPVNCDAGFLLLNVYRFYKPNPAEAKKAAQFVLSTIPPSVKLTTREQQFLIKQGVTPPQ